MEAEAAGMLGPVHKAPGTEAPRCTLMVARGSPHAQLQMLVLQTLPCGSFAKGVAGCVTHAQLLPACAPHKNVPLCFLLGLARRLAPLRARERLPPGTTGRPPGAAAGEPATAPGRPKWEKCYPGAMPVGVSQCHRNTQSKPPGRDQNMHTSNTFPPGSKNQFKLVFHSSLVKLIIRKQT